MRPKRWAARRGTSPLRRRASMGRFPFETPKFGLRHSLRRQARRQPPRGPTWPAKHARAKARERRVRRSRVGSHYYSPARLTRWSSGRGRPALRRKVTLRRSETSLTRGRKSKGGGRLRPPPRHRETIPRYQLCRQMALERHLLHTRSPAHSLTNIRLQTRHLRSFSSRSGCSSVSSSETHTSALVIQHI